MQITYTSHNFPPHYGPSFQRTNTLTITSQELLWAAITVGRANFIDVISHGVYSQYEILYRASMVVANVAQNGLNLVKSSAYQSLDPSEKSAVSYFLGLACSKLIAHRLLNVPWLLHIDVYRNHFRATGQAFRFGSSRSRPDLVGLDTSRRWIVMESKGRTHGLAPNLLNDAKNQTRNLRQIGASYPHLRVGAVTHFANQLLNFDWIDPEGHNETFFDLDTDIEEYLTYYYKLFVNILNNNETTEIGGYTMHTFSNVNLTIGLNTNILNAYTTKDLKGIGVQQVVMTQKFLEFPEQDFYVGSDGVVIGLGENWKQLIKTNDKFSV